MNPVAILLAFFAALGIVCYHKRSEIRRAIKSSSARRYPHNRY